MMGSRESAKAALEALDGQYAWEGMPDAMVVKWMDAELQKKRKDAPGSNPYGAMREDRSCTLAARALCLAATVLINVRCVVALTEAEGIEHAVRYVALVS